MLRPVRVDRDVPRGPAGGFGDGMDKGVLDPNAGVQQLALVAGHDDRADVLVKPEERPGVVAMI